MVAGAAVLAGLAGAGPGAEVGDVGRAAVAADGEEHARAAGRDDAPGLDDPEDFETLVVRGNLARWTGEAGDAAGARDQFAALLPVRERLYGPEDFETLIARGNLAYWTGEAGMRPGRGTSPRRCCRYGSGCLALSTPTP